MKRIIASILFFVALLTFAAAPPFTPSAYAANGYGATALTGGTAGCLDAINGSTLTDGDKAFVTTTTQFYVYNLDASSATAESSPSVISPDTNAGDKRWELVYIVTNGKGIDEGRYAADAQASDTYVITLSPVPAAYYTGMQIYFTANTINTGAATLNVNALGAKTIKKHHNQDLANGDIEAAQLVLVVYDGTNFQMQSQVGAVTGTGSTVKSDAPTGTGNWTIPTISLTGGQIAFPATAVPSADPNTLDDYEEGAWTPILGGDATYSTNTGHYTKIGNTVFIRGHLAVTLIGTGSVGTISGLPFTATAHNYPFSVYFDALAVNEINLVGMVVISDVAVEFYGSAAAANTLGAADSIFGNDASVIFCGHYSI